MERRCYGAEIAVEISIPIKSGRGRSAADGRGRGSQEAGPGMVAEQVGAA
jgi:hypothetical protein